MLGRDAVGCMVLSLAVLLTACIHETRPPPPPSPSGTSFVVPQPVPSPLPSSNFDGIYRTAVERHAFTASLDPTSEAGPVGRGLLTQLLVRTLVTYRHDSGPDALTPVPDLATDTGEVSSDGLTWTYHLKPGVMFAPNLNREVTSRDVEFAFRRMESASLKSRDLQMFEGVIVGMDGRVDGIPPDITGIDEPSDRIVVFHLEHPTADFPMRLTLPSTGPIPPEVGRCFARTPGYGRDLAATGPLMIEHTDVVLPSPCATLRPATRFPSESPLELTLNPNYDPSTDAPDIRSNELAGVWISIADRVHVLAEVASGELTGTLEPYSAGLAASVRRRPGLTVHVFRTRIRAISTVTGPGVVRYVFDEADGMISLCHLGLYRSPEP